MARHENTQREIDEFTERIGATPIYSFEEVDPGWPGEFRDRNYFRFREHLMIVKASDIDKYFWGVSRDYIDHFNINEDYLLVLLGRAGNGWLFRKVDVGRYVARGIWKAGKDGDYKINVTTMLKLFEFTSAKHFHKKLNWLVKNMSYE